MTSTFNVKVVAQPSGIQLSEIHFSVQFPNNIPIEVGEDLPEYIPVQISVQTPGRWEGLSSVVCPVPQDGSARELLRPSTFPFLPLHEGFDPIDREEWKWLANVIQEYLLENPHLYSDFKGHYLFARELFWMAFIATYPAFPHGAWPLWDSQIAMDGDFVSHWVVDRSDELRSENDDAIRLKIWQEFSMAVEQNLLIDPTF